MSGQTDRQPTRTDRRTGLARGTVLVRRALRMALAVRGRVLPSGAGRGLWRRSRVDLRCARIGRRRWSAAIDHGRLFTEREGAVADIGPCAETGALESRRALRV